MFRFLVVFVCVLQLISVQVFAQGISNVRLQGNPAALCAGATYTVMFDTASIGGGTFQMQISAPTGSFVSPTFTQNSSQKSITFQVHGTLVTGNQYAIRVIRISPSILYSDSLKNLSLSNPQANFSFSPNNACPATPVGFTNTSAGQGALTYAWTFNNTYTFGAPANSVLAEPNVIFNPFFGGGTITYGVKLRVTDAFGCSDSMSANVGVRQRPLAALQDSNVFAFPAFSNCGGAPSSSNPNYRLSVINACEVKATIANISIDWGSGLTQNFAGNFTQASHVYTALGAYNLVIQANNVNGCSSTQEYLVSNQLSPTLSLGGPANKQGCAPFRYPIVMSNYVGNSAGTYYVFDFNDGTQKLRIDTVTSDTVWHTFNTNSCNRPGGFFVVRATAYNRCDSTSATLGNFRVWTKPNASFNVLPSASICGGDSAQFVNTTQSAQYGVSCTNTTLYTWQFMGGNISSSNLATPPKLRYTLGGVFPVRLIATNPCGSDTFVQQVCVQAPPLANFTYAFIPANACKNNVLQLKDSSSTSTACGISSLQWRIMDSSSNLPLQAGIHYDIVLGNVDSSLVQLVFKNRGKYKIRLFIENACGTSTRDTFLSVSDVPQISFATDTVVYCDSISIAFNGAAPAHRVTYDSSYNQAMGFLWQVSPAGFTFMQGNASSRNPVIKFVNNDTVPKIYAVVHQASSLCGVSLTDTQYVVINPKPRVFVVGSNQIICSGQATQLNLSSNIIGGVSYTWRAYSLSPSIAGFSNQTTAALGPIAQTLFNNGSSLDTVFYKIVAYQASTLCRGDSSNAFAVLVQPNIQNNLIGGAQPICAGDTAAVINGNIPVGGSGNLRYQWQRWLGTAWVNTALADTLAHFSPGVLQASSYFRRLVNAANCALAPASVSNVDTVIVYPKPAVQAGNNINSCINNPPFVLSAAPSGGIWSGAGLSGPNSFAPAIVGLGSFPLIYTFTDTNNCRNSDTLQIIVNPAPNVEAGNGFTLCENSDTISLSGFSPSGGIWSGLGMVGGNRFLPTLAGFGTHWLRYTFTNSQLCSNSDSLLLTLKQKPSIQFTATPANNACAPFAVQFTNTSNANNGDALSSMRFIWRMANLGLDTFVNSSYLFGNTGVVDSVYAVKLVGENSWGCKDSSTQNIRVWANAKAQFTAAKTAACAPFVLDSNLIQTQHFAAANAQYAWFVNGVLVGNTRGFPGHVLSNALDSVWISLKVQAFNGCTADSMALKFETIGNPKPNFVAQDSVACSGTLLSMQNNSVPSTGLKFSWYLGSVTDTSTLFEPSQRFYNYGNQDTLVKLTLIAEIGSSTCKDSVSKWVRILPLPKVNFSLSDTLVCFPKTVLASNVSAALPVLQATAFRWLVSPNATLSNDTSNSSLLLSFADNQSGLNPFFTLTLRAQSIAGCIDSTQKRVQLATRPVAQFTSSLDSACAPFSSLLQNTSLYSQSTQWRVWQSELVLQSDTAASNSLQVLAHSGNTPASYTLQLKSISSAGCTDSVQKSFTAFPLPEPTFTSVLDSGCAPFLSKFYLSGLVQKPLNAFWNFGDGNTQSSSSDSITHSFLGAQLKDTSYSVKLVLSSFKGCKDSLLLANKVKVKTVPKAFFTTNIDSACSPLDVFVSDGSFGNPQQYKWLFGNGDSSLAKLPPQPLRYISNDTPRVFTLQLRVDNECGSDTFSKNLLVRAEYIVSAFSASAKIGCETLAVAFGDASVGAKNIAWDFGDGFGSNQRNPMHTYTQPGTYTVYQYASNRCSFDTSAQVITVLPKPNFNVELPVNSVCQGTPINFRSNLFTTGNLLWDFGDGNTSAAQNPTHSYGSGGQKILRVTFTSLINNCTSTIIDTQFVHAKPLISLVTDTNVACFGHPFQFAAVASENPYFNWDMGDGVLKIGSNQNDYIYALPGTYQIKVIAQTIYGCKDSITRQVNVWPAPKVAFDFNPKDTCDGPAWVQFTNLSSGANAFVWDLGNGNTATSTDAQAFYSGLGKYPILLTGTNAFGCKDTASAVFEILEQAFASFEMDDSSGCLPYPVQFTNTSKGAKTYVWYFGDGGTSTEENPLHTYTQAGTFWVSLVAKAGVVCQDSFTFFKPITVDEKAGINFSHELVQNTVPYRTVNFTANALNDFVFEWRFGEGSRGVGRNVSHVYRERDSGCFNIELKVITNNNCDTLYTDTICLPSYWEGLSLPNAFTPDYGTDEVRVFKPIGLGLIQYQIKIYNKWGALVWEDDALENGTPARGWDGRDVAGVACMPGSYIWVVEATFISGKTWEGAVSADGKRKHKRGSLTLIR